MLRLVSAIRSVLAEAETKDTMTALKSRKDVQNPEALAGYLYWKHYDKPPNPTGKGGFTKKARPAGWMSPKAAEAAKEVTRRYRERQTTAAERERQREGAFDKSRPTASVKKLLTTAEKSRRDLERLKGLTKDTPASRSPWGRKLHGLEMDHDVAANELALTYARYENTKERVARGQEKESEHKAMLRILRQRHDEARETFDAVDAGVAELMREYLQKRNTPEFSTGAGRGVAISGARVPPTRRGATRETAPERETRPRTKRPTFRAAREMAYEHLRKQGWDVVSHLKTPHATSPDGKTRLWFKPQAVHISVTGDERGMPKRHSADKTSTVGYDFDLRAAVQDKDRMMDTIEQRARSLYALRRSQEG